LVPAPPAVRLPEVRFRLELAVPERLRAAPFDQSPAPRARSQRGELPAVRLRGPVGPRVLAFVPVQVAVWLRPVGLRRAVRGPPWHPAGKPPLGAPVLSSLAMQAVPLR